MFQNRRGMDAAGGTRHAVEVLGRGSPPSAWPPEGTAGAALSCESLWHKNCPVVWEAPYPRRVEHRGTRSQNKQARITKTGGKEHRDVQQVE